MNTCKEDWSREERRRDFKTENGAILISEDIGQKKRNKKDVMKATKSQREDVEGSSKRALDVKRDPYLSLVLPGTSSL